MERNSEQKERLIAAGLKRKDKSAMRDFYEEYSGRLTAVCSRYIISRDDVKDVLQDALLKIYTSATKFEYRGCGSLLAWSTRIVVNEALSHLRKNRTLPLIDDNIIQEPADDDLPPVDKIPPKALHEMIRKLPEGYRTVFNLFVFEDMPHREIARLLGIKEASSASQLLRARKILREEINEYLKRKGDHDEE